MFIFSLIIRSGLIIHVANAKFPLLKLPIYELSFVVYIYDLEGLECLRLRIEPLWAIGTSGSPT
jgi:hypothetical protein